MIDEQNTDFDPVIHEDESESLRSPSPGKILTCILYFLLIFLAIMGIAYFGHGLRSLNNQLNFGMAQKAWDYGNKLQSEGWQVEYPAEMENFIPPTGDGSLIFFMARESEDNAWVEYIWEFYQSSDRSRAILRERGMPDNLWWLPSRTFLIPLTEAALDAHKELDLPLPDDFVVGEMPENLIDAVTATQESLRKQADENSGKE